MNTKVFFSATNTYDLMGRLASVASPAGNVTRYSYDGRGNLVKEEEICAPTTQGAANITVAEYVYDETNRMVYGANEKGEVSGYTYNGLGVRVGTELILEDNSHGYTDFHCQTPGVETGIETPEVVLTDYVIDYNRVGVDQRVLTKSETDGYDFRYVYGLDKLQVKVTGEGSDYDTITVDQGFRALRPEITFAGHEFDEVLGQFFARARMYARGVNGSDYRRRRGRSRRICFWGSNTVAAIDAIAHGDSIAQGAGNAIGNLHDNVTQTATDTLGRVKHLTR